jgi:D-alanyl-D-alanine carboxypeptidase/D-alanyl-D-alanine-endopeptidase (penicillin-binding protein 4)
MSRRGRGLRGAVAATVLLLTAAAGAYAADPAGPSLVWHVETAGGTTVAGRHDDEPINPASVVKVATTVWALERLGASHRFATQFGIRGTLDPASGVLDGDLIVTGGGDPDFHVENAMLAAAALNAVGLREVRGRLVVDDAFWIGWEGGSERREHDRARRAQIMATRMRAALDARRWSDANRRGWERSVARRRYGGPPPRVIVRGEAIGDPALVPTRVLVTHRSNPLVAILKRLNVHSNNDIERLEANLGPPAELATVLRTRWHLPASALRLETLSGLGSNRVSTRAIVRLLGDLARVCEMQGIDVSDLLAESGCDTGTLQFMPGLAQAPAGALVAKTGTLVVTDGGVVALAGYAHTGTETMRFAVAVPGAGGGVSSARGAVARWLRDLVAARGGFHPQVCGRRSGYPDDAAEIELSG